MMLSPDRERADQYWSQVMPGRISDLNVASELASPEFNGDAHVLVTLVPDSEHGTGLDRPHLMRLSSSGKVIWKRKLKSRVKWQTFSSDGELIVLTTYDEKLRAFSGKGDPLWEVDKNCEPRILARTKRVICHFDDDSAASLAFQVYDWKGKKLHEQRVSRDLLALSISKDEKRFALGLTEGKVLLLGEDYKEIWKKRVSGEIVSLDVYSDPSDPKKTVVAVLYIRRINLKDGGQKLALFDHLGGLVESVDLSTHVDLMDLGGAGGDGKSVYLYGNSPQGQYLARLAIQRNEAGEATGLQEHWQVRDPHYADFSSKMRVVQKHAIVGFENLQNDQDHTRTHLFLFDREGKVVSDLQVATEEGGYLFAPGFTRKRKLVFLATDTARLNAYRVNLANQ